MANQRSKRKQGFLKDFNLSEQYLARPDATTGRPGLIEGVFDGVNVLIKLWPRKPKQNDEDLAEIWRHELRQLHRLKGYPGAGDRIASLLSTGQDSDGFYLVLDPGQRRPLETMLRQAPPAHWLKAPRNPANRLRIWLNLARIVRALETLHSQGLLHRNVDAWAILSSGMDEPDFQLTGFEWSMRLSGTEQPSSKRGGKRNAEPAFDSFRSDWIALGALAAGLLAARPDRLSDLSIPASDVADHMDALEVRLLRKLLGVEPLDRLDGDVIGESIAEISRRLEAGVAQQDAQYRLVVRLGPHSKLTQDIRSASDMAIEADDIEAQIEFIRDDLAAQALLIAVKLQEQPTGFRFLLRGHQLLYRLQPYRQFKQEPTWDLAYCETADSQPPLAKYTIGSPLAITSSALHVMTSAEAAEAFPRIRRRVASWEGLRSKFAQSKEAPSRERQLLRAFALSQLVEMSFAVSDIFPIRILARPTEAKDEDGRHHIQVEVRQDPDREQLAKALKLRSPVERFEQMLNVENVGEEGGWTLTDNPTLGDRAHGETEWRFVRQEKEGERATFLFAGAEPPPPGNEAYLLPSGSVGTIVQFKRRIKALGALAEHLELLQMLTDQRSRLFDSQDTLDDTDAYFTGLDGAKQEALRELIAILPLYLIQGPPGVGKTHLVRELVRRRFAEEPTTRLLLTAQSHAAIDHLMGELKVLLGLDKETHEKPLVVRCRKKDRVGDADPFDIQQQASTLLNELVGSSLINEGTADLQARLRALASESDGSARGAQERGSNLRPQSGRAAFESVVLRAANVVFATTNAPELERLIEERGQFDWSIVEEAGKATGGELVAPLLLSHRRLMIGDHKQLPPYRSDEMRALLESSEAMHEVVKVAPNLISRSLRGAAVDDLLEYWQDGDVNDVGGAAIDALLMFETMIEREFSHQKKRGGARKIARSLTVQHRMHPDIAALVSHTFYNGELVTDPEREARFTRELPPFDISPGSKLPNTPITMVTMPDIQSMVKLKQGDTLPPWSNKDEVASVLDVLAALRAKEGVRNPPTLAVLSPYAQQVKRLHREIESARGSRLKHLTSFATATGSQSFCSTVDAFQGSEADVVVISLVRNNQFTKPSLALGFLRDFRRMNVLLSRARSKMVIVGSLDFLRSVTKAQPNEPGGKYEFLKKLIVRVDEGIATGRIGAITAASLQNGKGL